MKNASVAVERISAKEHAEIDAILAEMRKGKETPWRKLLRPSRKV